MRFNVPSLSLKSGGQQYWRQTDWQHQSLDLNCLSNLAKNGRRVADINSDQIEVIDTFKQVYLKVDQFYIFFTNINIHYINIHFKIDSLNKKVPKKNIYIYMQETKITEGRIVTIWPWKSTWSSLKLPQSSKELVYGNLQAKFVSLWVTFAEILLQPETSM